MRVLLAGGGAAVPYTLEFFNEKLSLPIEFFNPLRRISVAASADAEAIRRSSLALGECTGMAARLLFGDSPLEIGLESPRLKEDCRGKARRPFLAAALVLLAATLSVGFLHFKTAADQVAALNAQLDAKTAGLQEFKRKIDGAAAERDRLLQDFADLAAAPMLRTTWATILDEVAQNVPGRHLWITSLRPVAGEAALDPSKKDDFWGADAAEDGTRPAVTAVAVNGLYLENENGPAVVDAFVEKLAGSAVFAIDPAQKGAVVKLRVAQSGEAWAYEYQLVLPLKRPIPL